MLLKRQPPLLDFSSILGFPLDVLRIRLLFGVAVHNFFNGFGFTFSFTILKSGLVWPVQRNIKEALESQLGGGTFLFVLSES